MTRRPTAADPERRPHEPRGRDQRQMPGVLAPDGLQYSAAVNDDINSVLSATFSRGPGLRAMAYLESITTRRVMGPDVSDGHLRHLEGARWLVGVIRARIAQAQKS